MTDRELFIAALDHADPADRDAWLDLACAGDAERRRRVDVLLRAHDQASKFLAAPAAEQLGPEPDDPTRTAHSADETTPATAIDLQTILAPTDKPGLLGKLDHYEVLEVVGTGGMGVVLKAFDPKLHRLVAIKLMAPHLAAHASARKRFEREARAVAAVKNEHVVAIHQVETEGRTPYLVMEFVGGVSLQDRLERHGPFDVKEILRIGMQTARGLAAAHAQGIIHRDIKPANILLENGVERVKITDFGLARAVDDANLTRSGVIAGTPNYMSPEQSAGVPVDARSDLFSLGSVLYALCTGHPPFRAETPLAVLRRVADDPPRPIREVNPDVPDWLAEIVHKLLAKDSSDRFQTATEVADLVGRHLAHLQQPDAVPLPDRVGRPSESRSLTIVRVQATERGRVVSWSEFKRGRLVQPGRLARLLSWTTMLTDVVTDLIALARSIDKNTRLVIVTPNGPTTASFDLMLTGDTFEIICSRRLVRGGFPLNLLAAEFGSNYDVIVSMNRASAEVRSKVMSLLQSRYQCTAPDGTVEVEIEPASAAVPSRRRWQPGLDGRTAFAIGFGFFSALAGIFTASYLESFALSPEQKVRELKWLVIGSLLALLSFGPGVFVARRWWRKRQPSDRRADGRAAIFAGLGVGLTVATVAMIVRQTPAWREHIFDPRPEANLAISWDENNVETVELERGGAVVGTYQANAKKADLWHIPPGPYTLRAFLNGREVYWEDFELRPNEHRQISLLHGASEAEIYGDAGLFRVECSDPTVVATLTRPGRTVTLSQPGRSSVIASAIRPGQAYQFTIVRGQQVLYDETVRMKPMDRRNICIPRVVLPDRTVELKPKTGKFPTDVTRIEIAPDRSGVAVGRPGGSILVFDAGTGRERFTVDRPKTNSSAFGFSHNGRHLAFVVAEPSGEHVIRVVSAADGDFYQRLTVKSGKLANAGALAYSPDGQRIAVSSTDTFSNNRSRSRIHRWQLAESEPTPQPLDPLEWQDGTIEAMRFTVYGAEILAASQNRGTAAVWKWDTKEIGALLEEKTPLAFLAAGQRLNFVAAARESPELWSWRRGQVRWSAALSRPLGPIRSASLALGPDDELVAIGTQGGGEGLWEHRAAVWLWRQSIYQAVLLGHSDTVLDVTFADDGRSILSASKDGTVRFWKLP